MRHGKEKSHWLLVNHKEYVILLFIFLLFLKLVAEENDTRKKELDELNWDKLWQHINPFVYLCKCLVNFILMDVFVIILTDKVIGINSVRISKKLDQRIAE